MLVIGSGAGGAKRGGGGRSQPCFDPSEQLNVAFDLGKPASQTPGPLVSEICSFEDKWEASVVP